MGIWDWLAKFQLKVDTFADTVMLTRESLDNCMVQWLPKKSHTRFTIVIAHFPSTFIRLQEVLDRNAVAYEIATNAIDHAWLSQKLARLNSAELEGKYTSGHSKNLATNARPLTPKAPHKQPLPTDGRNGKDEFKPNDLAPILLSLAGQLKLKDKPSGPDAKQKKGSHSATQKKTAKHSDDAPYLAKPVSVLAAERHFLRRHDQRIDDFLSQSNFRSQIGYFVALDDAIAKPFCSEPLLRLLEHYGMTANDPIKSQLVSSQIAKMQRKFARQINTDKFADSPERWLELNQAMPIQ